MSHVLIFQPAPGEKPEPLFGSRDQVLAWAASATETGTIVDGNGETRTVHRGAVCRVLRAWKHGEEAIDV
jgi:hypothetical protein